MNGVTLKDANITPSADEFAEEYSDSMRKITISECGGAGGYRGIEALRVAGGAEEPV